MPEQLEISKFYIIHYKSFLHVKITPSWLHLHDTNYYKGVIVRHIYTMSDRTLKRGLTITKMQVLQHIDNQQFQSAMSTFKTGVKYFKTLVTNDISYYVYSDSWKAVHLHHFTFNLLSYRIPSTLNDLEFSFLFILQLHGNQRSGGSSIRQWYKWAVQMFSIRISIILLPQKCTRSVPYCMYGTDNIVLYRWMLTTSFFDKPVVGDEILSVSARWSICATFGFQFSPELVLD